MTSCLYEFFHALENLVVVGVSLFAIIFEVTPRVFVVPLRERQNWARAIYLLHVIPLKVNQFEKRTDRPRKAKNNARSYVA
jgi:hypothetical protein